MINLSPITVKTKNAIWHYVLTVSPNI